jgi:polar amino acid transport system substrate-binding protein
VISSGTERATVETSEKSLLGKALTRPDLAKQVLQFAHTNGIRAAYDKVKTRLDGVSPLGYSCSGVVIGVGEGVKEFQIGDRVACAGAGYANHSEINWIPRNLAVRVPDSVGLDAAALTTIGAIATQGLRQADTKFGETVVVIGAGLIGVLTILLAKASGCRVVAIDKDCARVQRASEIGAHIALLSSDPGLGPAVRDFSRYGADAAIVTAAAPSAEPLELAAQLLRERGRAVVVGDVGMGVSRPNIYHKELSIVMSRSYGPGRYDPSYEEAGNDYPVGYVRWTERRNMEAFLDALAMRSIDIAPLLERRYSITDSAQAYEEVQARSVYTVILEYPECPVPPSGVVTKLSVSRSRTSALRVGCIGAGGFAASHILPNLKNANGVSLEAVATASGITAESARRSFGVSRTETPLELLADPSVDAVFIASRHHSHAQYVSDALRCGKLVFVEKPLAVDRTQLERVLEAYRESSERGRQTFVMVGFNRRFAPATEQICRFFTNRKEPMFIQARINAGFLPLNHWVQQAAEGGRIIGECCHFVDWARYLVGHPIRNVSAHALPDGTRYNRDNVGVTLTFVDGSIASLWYLANGDSAVPKEYFEVFCEGAVARLEDFDLLQLTRGGKTRRTKLARDKGHRRELQMTVDAMVSGKAAPIPFEEIIEVTQATFAIQEAVNIDEPIRLAEIDTPGVAAGE